ncbi:MAG: heavy metal translocating P-type ATPase [Thermoanaerobaculia bacterium]
MALPGTWRALLRGREAKIALGAIVGIAFHLVLRLGFSDELLRGALRRSDLPLLAVLLLGGLPLVATLARQLFAGKFGSDLLAGISIVTAILLGEYLAGALVVLMLSGGETLEAYAVKSASSVLEALARRMPAVAHRRRSGDGGIEDAALDDLAIGDEVVIYPHETCPIDGIVVEGQGTMDEAYLTGEPYEISKTPGTSVISGAINGESALVVRATALAVDSRYTKILQVMRDSEQQRPRLRRLGDQLGAFYTPVAVAIAIAAWWISGNSTRFLAVMVVATPCPLLIAIPVAILGSISLSARRGIIIKDPAVLERATSCRVAIFDKTGTLTYGEPQLVERVVLPGFDDRKVLGAVASLEHYSRHPLSRAIVRAAEEAGLATTAASEVREPPGQGLVGVIDGRTFEVTSRKKLLRSHPEAAALLPPEEGGMECAVLIDGAPAALFRFRDAPRTEGKRFIDHLGPRHAFDRVLLVSGDRESEVRYLADAVGIREVHFSQSPEQKVEIVRAETARAPTLFMGDGVNDAPALTAATVGLAFGQASDVTAEAAGAVILDSSLARVDEFLHISHRMRKIALQSAVGGMLLSLAGMGFAAVGLLPPVAGALAQEAIDVAAVFNALRAAWPPRDLTDF